MSFAAFRTHILPRHFTGYSYSLIDAPGRSGLSFHSAVIDSKHDLICARARPRRPLQMLQSAGKADETSKSTRFTVWGRLCESTGPGRILVPTREQASRCWLTLTKQNRSTLHNFLVFFVFFSCSFPSSVFFFVQAMFLSRDGQYLLMGGDGGVVSVWQVHDLKQLFTYPGCDAGIRSMAMSHDQRYAQPAPV